MCQITNWKEGKNVDSKHERESSISWKDYYKKRWKVKPKQIQK